MEQTTNKSLLIVTVKFETPSLSYVTDLRNFTTFSLACLFYFQSEKFRTSVNG